MVDEITLTIPRDADFHRVAHLVLGGLAVRMNLTVENLEDLQIALDSILGRSELEAGDITVRMSLRDGALETTVGPVPASVLEEIEREQDSELSLRRVLDSTVDDVHVTGDMVTLTKNVSSVGEASGG